MDVDYEKVVDFAVPRYDGSLCSMEKTTLVVDDNSVTRKIAMMLASKLGFKTSGATNGQEAVELYRSGQRFDLVIMDMEMPIMDGIDATRVIRSMGAAECIIIGATASDDEHQKRMFMEAGLNHLLSRPITKEKLEQLLN
ncbi:two-component response regulator 24-like [Apium graveolens]|uniref:two-component response regulator 24-like n=1 Tax=Apium graveolens TaxID=4045 RepID=UPI003D78E9E8